MSETTSFFLPHLSSISAVANEVRVVYGVRIMLAEEELEGDKVQIDGYSSQPSLAGINEGRILVTICALDFLTHRFIAKR